MTRLTTRAGFLLLISVVELSIRGEVPIPPAEAVASDPSESNGTVAASPAADRHTIQQYGLTFILSRSTRSDSTATEEYFLQGESAESWSQMITYQRLILAEPLGAGEYVTWLKKHFEQTHGGPRLKVVRLGKAASIFGVQYDKTDTTGGQFGLVLVTVADPRRPNELHLIQYAINVNRISPEETDLQIKRWQALFQSQAESVGR